MAEDTMALLDETDLVVMKPGQVLFRKGERQVGRDADRLSAIIGE